MNRVYTQMAQGNGWLRRYWGHRPRLACILGFTETGLIPGISAAGATPEDRRVTAIADAEFLFHGATAAPRFPLPPLSEGVSPVLISRAIIAALRLPVLIFNAGLPQTPSVPHIVLSNTPAACLSTGRALPKTTVIKLLNLGLSWGHRLGNEVGSDYVIVGECVVGGTTTALALLVGLGFSVWGQVSSSHANCNHGQKRALVQQGLAQCTLPSPLARDFDPLAIVAAVGDPMQVVAAGMAIAASCHGGVMLAGGTQMLAVYALARAIAQHRRLPWQPERIVVGTTRWVAEDASCDAVGLATQVGDVPFIATQLSFATARHQPLQQYEAGFVKEGVAAGGCAIAASLYQAWQQPQLLHAIETLYEQTLQQQSTAPAEAIAPKAP